MQLNAREKKFVIGGSLIAVLLLAYLLWPRAEPVEPRVELAQPSARSPTQPAAVAVPPPGAAPAPAPVPLVQAAPAPAPQAAAPAASGPEGLRLHGVMAGGAIFGLADGSQRYVPTGRFVLPGIRLSAVRVDAAMLEIGGQPHRLGFSGAPTPLPAGD